MFGLWIAFGRIAILGALTLGLGCAKSSPKGTGFSAASEETNYIVTLVIPNTDTNLALADNQISFTSFDADGNQISTGLLEPIVSNGVSTAELRVNTKNLYTIDSIGLGAVVSPTGDAPGTNIQVPMTLVGKNVVEAIKSLPKEYRTYFDVAAAQLMLPPGSMSDNSKMKDLIIALAEQGKSMPTEKRIELNLQRAKMPIDYIDIIRNSGDLDLAVASTYTAASKIFAGSNPDLADNPIVQLSHRPADAITSIPALLDKVHPDLKNQVVSQALTQQVVSAIVANNDGKVLSTADLLRITPALEGVKTKYLASKALSDDFALKFIESVKSETFTTDGRPKSFDPAGFSSVIMESVKKSDANGTDFVAFQTNIDRYNSNTEGCVAWRNTCTAGGLVNPSTIADEMQKGARAVIDQLTKLPDQDKAILGCSAVATSLAITIATACADGNCLANNPSDAYNEGAKTACKINSCLKTFIKNPATEAMSQACDAGSKLATSIKCNGFPGIGGGLGKLCDTEIEASKPQVLKECPYAPSVPACVSTRGPKTPDEIRTECLDQIQAYKSDKDFPLFQGNCLAKCEALTAAASGHCKITSCPGGFELVNDSCIAAVGRTTVIFEGCDYLFSNSLNQDSDLSPYGFPRSDRWRVSGSGYYGAAYAIAMVRCEVASPLGGLPELNLPPIMSDCIDRWGNTLFSQNQPRQIYRYDFDPNLSCP
jgi:hypothetical protein